MVCLLRIPVQGVGVAWAEAASGSRDITQVEKAIEQERAIGGYSDLVPVSNRLLEEARASRDDATALSLVRLAVRASPETARYPGALAGLSTSRGFSLGTILGGGATYAGRLLADPWVQATWVSRLVAVLCAAGWAVVLAVFALGAASRGGALVHDYADSFPWRLRRFSPTVFAILTISVLWTAGCGPAVLLLLLSVFLIPYLPRRGQVVLGVCLAVGCALPWGASRLAAELSPAGVRAWALYRVWKGDGGPELVETVDTVFPPGHARGAFARSRLARRAGDFAQARAVLAGAAPTGDERGLFLTEEGNLEFLQGNYDRAADFYERAAAARPEDPIPWFNLHVTHLARLEIPDADRALAKAKAIDEKTVLQLRGGNDGGVGELLPASHALPREWIRAELLGDLGATPPWVRSLTEGLFIPVRAMDPLYFGIFALLTVLVSGREGKVRRTHRCPLCGALVCPRCSRRVKESMLCPACWNVRKGGELDATEKDRQQSKAARWLKRSRRWAPLAGALVPGWSVFLVSEKGRGWVVGVLWALAVGWIAVGVFLPLPRVPWGTPGVPWAGIGLLLATHLWGMRMTQTSSTSLER